MLCLRSLISSLDLTYKESGCKTSVACCRYDPKMNRLLAYYSSIDRLLELTEEELG